MNNAAELVELRKQGSITQEEFFVALNQLRRANTGSASAIAEASAEVVVVGGVDKAPVPGVNSSSSTASAVDTARRPSEEDEIVVEDCAGDDGGGGAVGGEASSVNGPAETSQPDTVARSPLTGSLCEAGHHVSSITAQQSNSNDDRVDDAFVGATTTSPGVEQPPLPDGNNTVGDVHTETRCQRESPRSLLPGDEQQCRVPDTEVVGGDSRRQADDEIDKKHDECEAAQQTTSDDDSGWHISPSGENTPQSTSNRRRSSIASPERPQRQHAYRRTPESGGDPCVGPSSAVAEGFNDYGTELAATSETGLGADEEHSRPGTVQLVEPTHHQSSSSRRTGRGRLCRSQPATPSRSFDGHGDCSQPRLAAGFSPRESDGGCNGEGIADSSTRSAPKPHWRPAGGELFQPHWQRCSSTTSRRQMARSKPNTPSRLRPGIGATCQGGDHADNGGRPAWGGKVSPRRSDDGRTMTLRTERSPAKPPWRPAGEVDFQPRSQQSGTCCRSQTTATPSGFSSQVTASDPTLTTWSGATSSAGSGYVERSGRRNRLGNACPSDPCRAASQQQLRPKAHREGKAPPPAAGATPGGYRAAATPFASRRRRRPRNNTTAEEQDGTTTTPQPGQAPSISPTRVAHIGDRHELDNDDNGGETGAGTGLPARATGGLWRSRGRHREPRGAPRRRHSGHSTGSVGSFDSDRYFTTAVRCDRYGYPLHERECLGSYGADAGLNGGGGPRYSPMIKGLPDFYDSRPKRQSRDDESLGRRTHGINREAPAGRSASLYQRTTEWRAQASEIRYEIG